MPSKRMTELPSNMLMIEYIQVTELYVALEDHYQTHNKIKEAPIFEVTAKQNQWNLTVSTLDIVR